MEMVSRPHVNNFIAWCRDKPEVLVLTADLTNSCEAGAWRETYPDRFFAMGMAEQNMLGFAAGLAREGFEPFIHTFSVFIYRRAYDQLAMSIAYPNLPVRMMGFLPGIVTPGGVTHQAIEDIALMRATPNMTIFDTGDATDVESVLDVAHAVDGPVFVRMLRGDLPRLFPANEPMIFNRARILSQGDDVSILSSSVATEEALRAVAVLKAKGVSVHHLHVSTLKPFSDPTVLDAITRSRGGVITMENHSIIGGLGSAVAELMAESAAAKPLLRLGLDDTYAHGASPHYLMKEYGLDAGHLIKAVEQLLHVSLEIDERELGEVNSREDISNTKVEAL